MIVFLLQASEVARQAEESQSEFFGGLIWLIVFVPLLLALVIGLANKKKKQTVREYTRAELVAEIRDGAEPLLVHFYSEWTIGDQVMIAQVEKIAATARDYRVGFICIERHPEALGLYSHIEPPALLLFAGGKRIFQCEGVFDGADVVREVDEAIARWQRS